MDLRARLLKRTSSCNMGRGGISAALPLQARSSFLESTSVGLGFRVCPSGFRVEGLVFGVTGVKGKGVQELG